MSLVSLRERKNVLLLHPVRFYCSYFVHARQPMSWSDLCNGGGTTVGVPRAEITAAVAAFIIMAVAGFRRQDGIMYVLTAMHSVFE